MKASLKPPCRECFLLDWMLETCLPNLFVLLRWAVHFLFLRMYQIIDLETILIFFFVIDLVFFFSDMLASFTCNNNLSGPHIESTSEPQPSPSSTQNQLQIFCLLNLY